MGFLIFAFRKLSLKQEINRKQFRLTTLCMEQQRVQNEMGVLQQAKGMMQDAWGMISSSISQTSNSLFQVQGSAGQLAKSQALDEYNSVVNKNGGKETPEVKLAYQKYLAACDQATKQQMAAVGVMTGVQGANLAVNHAVNSIFDAASDYEMKMLQMKDQRISGEKTSLESQLKTMEAELQSVEKAEDQAAKDSAPKFGLS